MPPTVTERETDLIIDKINQVHQEMKEVKDDIQSLRTELGDIRKEIRIVRGNWEKKIESNSQLMQIHDKRMDDFEKKQIECITEQNFINVQNDRRAKMIAWMVPTLITAIFTIISIFLKEWK